MRSSFFTLQQHLVVMISTLLRPFIRVISAMFNYMWQDGKSSWEDSDWKSTPLRHADKRAKTEEHDDWTVQSWTPSSNWGQSSSSWHSPGTSQSHPQPPDAPGRMINHSVLPIHDDKLPPLPDSFRPTSL